MVEPSSLALSCSLPIVVPPVLKDFCPSPLEPVGCAALNSEISKECISPVIPCGVLTGLLCASSHTLKPNLFSTQGDTADDYLDGNEMSEFMMPTRESSNTNIFPLKKAAIKLCQDKTKFLWSHIVKVCGQWPWKGLVSCHSQERHLSTRLEKGAILSLQGLIFYLWNSEAPIN